MKRRSSKGGYAIDRFLRRRMSEGFRHFLLNRLLLFLFLLVSLYAGLVFLSGVVNLSRFRFHLVLFVALSTLPFFLLGRLPRTLWKRTVRWADPSTLLETYSFSENRDRKRIMEGQLTVMLRQKERFRPLRFRLTRYNVAGLAACLTVVVLSQVVSFVRYDEPALARRPERLPAEAEAPDSAAGIEPPAVVEETGGEAEKAAGDGEELASGPGAAVRREAERLRKAFEEILEEADALEEEAERGAGAVGNAAGEKEGGDLDSALRREGEIEGRQPEPNEGYQDAGKSFIDSPLVDYRPLLDEFLLDRDGDTLFTSQFLSEDEKLLFLEILFESFSPAAASLAPGDVLLDRLRSRYRELIDEKLDG